MALDQYDQELLRLVQEDSGQTAERMAEQVPLSASVIQRRLAGNSGAFRFRRFQAKADGQAPFLSM